MQFDHLAEESVSYPPPPLLFFIWHAPPLPPLSSSCFLSLVLCTTTHINKWFPFSAQTALDVFAYSLVSGCRGLFCTNNSAYLIEQPSSHKLFFILWADSLLEATGKNLQPAKVLHPSIGRIIYEDKGDMSSAFFKRDYGTHLLFTEKTLKKEYHVKTVISRPFLNRQQL